MNHNKSPLELVSVLPGASAVSELLGLMTCGATFSPDGIRSKLSNNHQNPYSTADARLAASFQRQLADSSFGLLAPDLGLDI